MGDTSIPNSGTGFDKVQPPIKKVVAGPVPAQDKVAAAQATAEKADVHGGTKKDMRPGEENVAKNFGSGGQQILQEGDIRETVDEPEQETTARTPADLKWEIEKLKIDLLGEFLNSENDEDFKQHISSILGSTNQTLADEFPKFPLCWAL